MTLILSRSRAACPGVPTVCVKKDQILTGLNKPEQFVLAPVEVGGDGQEPAVRNLREPFSGSEDTYFDVTRNYTWSKLFDRGQGPS